MSNGRYFKRGMSTYVPADDDPLRVLALTSARAHGCTCDPDVVVNPVAPTPVVELAHAPECALLLVIQAPTN